jgi:hypothetical protein
MVAMSISNVRRLSSAHSFFPHHPFSLEAPAGGGSMGHE